MLVVVATTDAGLFESLESALRGRGHTAIAVPPEEAATVSRENHAGALLVDWAGAGGSGASLLGLPRERPDDLPVVVALTSGLPGVAPGPDLARGPDGYIPRGAEPGIAGFLEECASRRLRGQVRPRPPAPAGAERPHAGVVMTASMGGPEALLQVLGALPATDRAVFLVVLHGPMWMLRTFVFRLRALTPVPVEIAEEGMAAAPGRVFIAPADRHLIVEAGTLALRLDDGKPVHHVRPSADPLFLSAARAFGRRCVAVVMTGLGRDGSEGAREVAERGGIVLVQSRGSCAASSMPENVADLGVAAGIVHLGSLAEVISAEIERLAE